MSNPLLAQRSDVFVCVAGYTNKFSSAKAPFIRDGDTLTDHYIIIINIDTTTVHSFKAKTLFIKQQEDIDSLNTKHSALKLELSEWPNKFEQHICGVELLDKYGKNIGYTVKNPTHILNGKGQKKENLKQNIVEKYIWLAGLLEVEINGREDFLYVKEIVYEAYP
jgi:hypothetical protein